MWGCLNSLFPRAMGITRRSSGAQNRAIDLSALRKDSTQLFHSRAQDRSVAVSQNERESVRQPPTTQLEYKETVLNHIVDHVVCVCILSPYSVGPCEKEKKAITAHEIPSFLMRVKNDKLKK